MKKLIAVFICIGLCFSFVGCNNTEKQNDEVKETLQKVLENEQTFISKTGVFSDEATEQTLEKYHFQTGDNAYYSFVPEQYTFVDMDNDDIDELVILDAKLNYYLVLHCENEKVNGYNIGVRSLIDLKTDGSFMTSGAAGINSIGNMCFDGSEFKVTDKALANDYDKEYSIDGKKTDQKTCNKYFDDWQENTTAVSWQKIDKQSTGLELDDGSTLYLQTDSIGEIEFKDEKGAVLLDSADVAILYLKSMPDFGYYVQVEFTFSGKEKFAQATRDNIGKTITVLANGEVISEPRVMDEITGGETIISGYESYEKAAAVYGKMKK